MKHVLVIFMLLNCFSATATVVENNENRWNNTKIQVAEYTNHHFHKSLSIFRHGANLLKTVTYKHVNSDAGVNTNLSDFDVIHISGDLNTDVSLAGQAELVVA